MHIDGTITGFQAGKEKNRIAFATMEEYRYLGRGFQEKYMMKL